MSWLQKLLPPKIKRAEGAGSRFPKASGPSVRACEEVLYSTDLENNQNVCPKCGHHHRLRARARLDLLLDPEGRFEIGSRGDAGRSAQVQGQQALCRSPGRRQRGNGEGDALVVMQGAIKTVPVVVACFEFDFWAVRWARWSASASCAACKAAIEAADALHLHHRLGGARMQEGLFSLMQMAKTTAAVTQLSAQHQLPFIRC
jgi:acetyl-CoA carboxylase carboxyl transferase subunit beta